MNLNLKGLIKLWSYCVLLWLPVSGVADVDFPEFPAAKFMSLKVISHEMVVNGLPTAAYQFMTSKTADDVAAFYKQQWKDQITDTAYGDWRILAHRDADFLFTVQIENYVSNGITHGVLGITPIFSYLDESKARKIKKKINSLGEGFKTLRKTEFIHDIEAVDQGKKSRTLLFTNKHSIKDNMAFYRQYYTQRGWAILNENTSENLAPPSALAMNKDGKQVNISFTQVDGKTHGVVVLVN